MKLTPELLLSRIKSEAYHQDGTLTIATLTLDNGFKVVGTSACLNPSNFNEGIGRKLAYGDAFGKLWALEGYYWATVEHRSVEELQQDKAEAQRQTELENKQG